MLNILTSILFFFVGAIFFWFLIRSDRGAKEPIGALWAAAGFGLASMILAVLLSAILLPTKSLTELANSPLDYIFITMLGVGLIEEACKFFPLAFFIYKKPYFNEHTDGIIYFAISGLVFGVIENFLYTIKFGTTIGIFRLILLPLFHVAGTAIIGFVLAKSKLQKKSLWIVLGAYVAVAVLHGVYNFSASSKTPILIVFALMISIFLTLSVFLLLIKANELDKNLGLSAVGNNNFCRYCGRANKEKTLYCISCGNKT